MAPSPLDPSPLSRPRPSPGCPSPLPPMPLTWMLLPSPTHAPHLDALRRAHPCLLHEGVGHGRREEGRLAGYHGRPQPRAPHARARHCGRHGRRLDAPAHGRARRRTRQKQPTRRASASVAAKSKCSRGGVPTRGSAAAPLRRRRSDLTPSGLAPPRRLWTRPGLAPPPERWPHPFRYLALPLREYSSVSLGVNVSPSEPRRPVRQFR